VSSAEGSGAHAESGRKPIPQEPMWDAVVVGAGPAGAMTAYELGRIGRKVLLLDRITFPRWKVCGATLGPGAQDILGQSGLGAVLPSAGAVPLHTLRLGGWSTRTDLRLNGSVSLSRFSLDSALVEAAIRAGVHFSGGARVKLGPLLRDRRVVLVSTDHGEMEISSRVVVAADGLASGLMGQAGVPSQPPGSGTRPLIGLGAVFPPSAPSFEAGFIHMAVGEEGYVGLVRVEDGSLNAAAAVSSTALKKAGSPQELVASLLERGGWPSSPGFPEGGWKGTPELTRRPRLPGAERLFAVGDASGYVEPFTGEGMFWALAGARLLAPLASRVEEAWDPRVLEAWTGAHTGLMVPAQRYCRIISWTLARPALARNLLRVLSVQPRLAGPFVRRIGAPISTLA